MPINKVLNDKLGALFFEFKRYEETLKLFKGMQWVALFKAPLLDLAIFVCVTTPLDNTIHRINHYPADKY